MADLTDHKIQQILRNIVREETRTIVREETQASVRAIVREETQAIIRKETAAIVQKEMRTVFRKEARDIVRKEVVKATDGMRQDLKAVKVTLGDHTKILDSHTKTLTNHTQILTNHTQILTDHTQILTNHTQILKDHSQSLDLLRQVQGSQSLMLRTLTTDVGQIKETVRAQGVFYEDLESRFTTLAENVSTGLAINRQVQTHETRLRALELLRPLQA